MKLATVPDSIGNSGAYARVDFDCRESGCVTRYTVPLAACSDGLVGFLFPFLRRPLVQPNPRYPPALD